MLGAVRELGVDARGLDRLGELHPRAPLRLGAVARERHAPLERGARLRAARHVLDRARAGRGELGRGLRLLANRLAHAVDARLDPVEEVRERAVTFECSREPILL